MVPELKGFAIVFTSTHQLFRRALEGVTPEQAMERPASGNPILWIAAHVVGVRAGFTRGLGGKVDVPWASQFPRGGAVESVTSWPTLGEVLGKWDEVHAEFMARLETLSSEALAAEAPFPGLDKTLLGVIGLAALHDAYHAGQLGAARRRHGLDRMVG